MTLAIFASDYFGHLGSGYFGHILVTFWSSLQSSQKYFLVELVILENGYFGHLANLPRSIFLVDLVILESGYFGHLANLLKSIFCLLIL